jgi:hypothetical protein
LDVKDGFERIRGGLRRIAGPGPDDFTPATADFSAAGSFQVHDRAGKDYEKFDLNAHMGNYGFGRDVGSMRDRTRPGSVIARPS